MNKYFRFNCMWKDKERTELWALGIDYRYEGDKEWETYSFYLVNDEQVHVALIDDAETFARQGFKQVESVNTGKGDE